jgi:flagellar biosynthesis protein
VVSTLWGDKAMNRGVKAAALRYNDELPAPIVIAAGKGALAAAIVRIAKENGVALVENPELADALIALDPGTLIPEELYGIVAEILVFVRAVGKNR